MTSSNPERPGLKFFEMSPDPAGVIGPDGHFVSVNAAYGKLHGYEPEELVGQPFIEIVATRDRDRTLETFRGVVERSEETKGFLNRHVTRNGGELWLETTARRDDETGNVIFINRDVTRRVQKEQDLDSLFSLSIDLMSIASLDGHFSNVSASYERVLGYSKEEITTRPWMDFVHPDDHERTLEAMSQLAKGLDVINFRNRYVTASGDVVWLTWNSHPADDGKLYAVARDDTRLVHQEARLNEINRRLVDAQRIAGVGDWIYDPIRGTVRFSEMARQIFNVQFDAENGGACALDMSALTTRIHPLDKEKWWKKYNRLLGDGTPYDSTHRIVLSDGSIRYISEHAERIPNFENADTHLHGTVHDVTAIEQVRKRQQRLIRHQRELLSLSRKLSGERDKKTIGLDVVRLVLDLFPTCTSASVWLESSLKWNELARVGSKLSQIQETGLHDQFDKLREYAGQKGLDSIHSTVSIEAVRHDDLILLPFQIGRYNLGCLVAVTILPNRIDEDSSIHMDLFEAIALQLASALANAHLIDDLRSLSRQINDAHEVERRNLARDLHDQVGATLTGINISLEMLSEGIGSDIDPETLKKDLNETRQILGTLMQQVRDVSLQLRPSLLDDFGLSKTIDWLAESINRRGDVKVEVHNKLPPRVRFDGDVETAAFRIVQESLTNVQRYAESDFARVFLKASERTLSIRVEDDGCGFDVGTALRKQNSVGLPGMRERAELIGGTFTVKSEPGHGTYIQARLPARGRSFASNGRSKSERTPEIS